MRRSNAKIITSGPDIRKYPSEVIAGILFISGTLLSYFGAIVAENASNETYHMQFKSIAHSYSTSLESQLTIHLGELHGLADFFESSDEVTRTEFKSFANSMLSRHPATIQAFMWIPRVTGVSRERFEHDVQDRGLLDFFIYEHDQFGNTVKAGQRPEYFPVLYQEHSGSRALTIGYDIGSDPVLLQTLAQTRDNGKISISEFSDRFMTPNGSDLLVFQPLYNDTSANDSVALRRAYLRGFVVAVLSIGNIIERAIPLNMKDSIVPRIAVQIYDITEPGYKNMIYPKSADIALPPQQYNLWQYEKQYPVADRKWLIDLSLDTTTLSLPGRWIFGAILAIGLICSGLLALLLYVVFKASRDSWKAANAIHESEQRQRRMLNNTASVIYMKDLEGRYTFINRAYEKQFQISESDIIGRTDYDIFPPDTADEFHKHDNEALTAEKPLEFEEVIPQRNGIHTYLSSRFTLKHTSGEIYALCGVLTDITERKNIEIQLRRTQKMDAIGQLTGGIAHDFNNLLAIIQGNAELLEFQLDNTDEVFQRINNIKKTTRRASDLTRQLLGFSRDTVKKIKTENINSLISELETLIARAVTPKIIVEHKLAEDLWLTAIDPGDFQNALLNLIFNARDAISSEGRLTLATRNRTLDTVYSSRNIHIDPGDYVELAVSDTGIGMPREVMESIFEPFYSTKEIGKGTGLGLSMVYGFVKRSQGTIDVYSELGRGTTFKIFLPRSGGSIEQADESVKTPDTLPQGSETVLIVDDETDLLQVAKESLCALGYNVLTATNGEQALKLMEKSPSIDLLISDVVMPGGMSGYDLARQTTDKYPTIKILLSSGFTEKVEMHSRQTYQHAELLNKPYTRSELAQKVRSLLNESKSDNSRKNST